jgi:hypothetical protein
MVSRNTNLSRTMKLRHLGETLDTPEEKQCVITWFWVEIAENYEFKKGEIS